MCIKEIFVWIGKAFKDFGDFAGHFVDIFEFLTFAIVIIVFLFATVGRLVRPIRKFLKNYGLGILETAIVLWKCKDNRLLYMRFYIESAIFATKGEKMDGDGWKKLRGLFVERLENYKKADEKSAKFIIRVNSVSDMINENTKAMIAEYFSFLAGEKNLKHFWPKANVEEGALKKDAFCSIVSVRGGYLAPLARIAGINERYQEKWEAIMETFDSTSIKSVLERSIFSYTYTWLMWGPSIQTAEQGNEYREVLGIYGYSDEAQSLFVSIPQKYFAKHFNNGELCASCEISGRIANPIAFVSADVDSYNDDSYPFLDRIKQHYRANHDYILDVDNTEEDSSCDHYFTAYIWAMFLAKNPGVADPALKFADCVVFFEHTNLSGRDKKSMQNVYNILADKFLREFEGSTKSYHFVASVNKDAREVLEERLRTLDNVSFNVDYSKRELLDAIDSVYVNYIN